VKGAVLLDALGTLVELQPPAPRLRALLAAEGFPVAKERARAAFRAEIAYYLEHHLDGRTREGLEELRDRCAATMLEALALPGLEHALARRVMLGALEFTPYPDAAPALEALRAAGHRMAIVSNWDCSLEDWLAPSGLLELVDGVVTSAVAGAAKPDPAIFGRALELLGTEVEGSAHVGDSLDNDVEGARAAGIRPILVARDRDAPAGVEAIGSLAELPSLL
jgi:putative hydrolase of the HAD superfamily